MTHQCTKEKKKRFTTRDNAQRFADRMLRKHGWKIRAYKCDVCLEWHLTTKTSEEFIASLSDGALRQYARRVGKEIAADLDRDLKAWAARLGEEIKSEALR